ncbi:hypothetical protein COT29_02400 [Candidatus Micrarchaeota archaeon CG08_land_8_20_14_0_20_59_11]|nr:MAG: hypothetical protein COT29_02400 [Candidatus Micrarchaeota archaeon CG08_land_8_20_14_0_20_59_11]
MDLLEIVIQPTWREFLVDLVASERMDPWDLDIVQVADVYLSRVRQIKALDLRLPANVILASAIMLHYKADALRLEEVAAEPEEYAEPKIDEDLPELMLKANRPRSRRVTLDELVRAVGDVMRSGRKGTPRAPITQVFNLDVPTRGMNERMQELYEKASAMKDSEDIVLFSSLIGEWTPEFVISCILPLMHLVQEERMMAWQDEYFGEIFLKVLEGKEVMGAEAAANVVEGSAAEAVAVSAA